MERYPSFIIWQRAWELEILELDVFRIRRFNLVLLLYILVNFIVQCYQLENLRLRNVTKRLPCILISLNIPSKVT